ncbi:MAG: DUF177 domain-containing protein [Chloroflexi bacterium]|nr:DUF177 domain-containing protein [Chloroflexota bacterium]
MAKHKHSPLTFNVAQLLREEVGSRRHHEFTEEVLPLHERESLRNIAGTARFTRTPSGVYVESTVTGVIHCDCMRCLQPARVAITVTFTEEYVASVDVTTGASLVKHVDDDEDDDRFFIDEHHLLDLGVALREYALLELPMRPLCKSDCRGLCAGCGVDLNVEACRCHQEPVDERFAALKALLDSSESQ